MAREQVVVVRRHLDPAALATLADTGCCLTVDVAQLRDADLSTVDALARLALAAARAGGTLRLCNAPAPLVELLELAGLADVL